MGLRMKKTGLVLEGGAMRGMYTAGVLDVFLEHDITFDGVIGVSMGAITGCSYYCKRCLLRFILYLFENAGKNS